MASSEEILTLDEMTRQFQGRRLAVRVTARDEAGQPAAGEVLADKPSRLEVSEAVKGEAEVCVIYAGAPAPEGYGVLYRDEDPDRAG